MHVKLPRMPRSYSAGMQIPTDDIDDIDVEWVLNRLEEAARQEAARAWETTTDRLYVVNVVRSINDWPISLDVCERWAKVTIWIDPYRMVEMPRMSVN